MTKPAQSVEFREPEWLARMETALEVLNDEVVIADDRPRILFANSRFVEMIGIPAVELIGFDPSNFYSSQEWDFVAKQDEHKHLDEQAIRTRCPSCLDP
jgi:PAS domain-containing protein